VEEERLLDFDFQEELSAFEGLTMHGDQAMRIQRLDTV
jgi:hypothetical protein